MAKSYEQIINSTKAGNIMDWTNALNRLSGVPVDITSTQENYNAAVKYAAENAIAYEGQILSVPSDGDIFVYVITPVSQGKVTIDEVEYDIYIKEVGSVPEVDGSTIIINAEGKLEAVIPEVELPEGDNNSIEVVNNNIIKLKNFGTGYYKYVPESNTIGYLFTNSEELQIRSDAIEAADGTFAKVGTSTEDFVYYKKVDGVWVTTDDVPEPAYVYTEGFIEGLEPKVSYVDSRWEPIAVGQKVLGIKFNPEYLEESTSQIIKAKTSNNTEIGFEFTKDSGIFVNSIESSADITHKTLLLCSEYSDVLGDYFVIESIDAPNIVIEADIQALVECNDYQIEWYEPSTETIDGVNANIQSVQTKVDTLEGNVETVKDDVAELESSIYGDGGTAENPAKGSIAANVNDLVDTVGSAEDALSEDVDTLWAHMNAAEEAIGTQAKGETAATGLYGKIEDAKQAAIEAATYDDTQVKEDIKTNADNIAQLRDDVDAIEIPDVPVTNVSGDSKVISVTPTNGDYKVSATLSLNYDRDTTKLQLLGINSEVVHEIDAKAFIKDGMLDKVELDTETEEGKAYLVLTWNDDADKGEKTVTKLDVTELIDVYTAGHGIKIENAEINLKLGTGSETVKYLTATEDGLNISGVDKAISDAVDAHNANKSHLTSEDVDGQIDAKLTAAGYDKKITDAQAAATTAATNADFITSVDADDNLVVTDKKLHLKDGYQLLADTDKAKLDKLTLTGGDLTISGSVEAGSVQNLDQWITGNRAKVDGLYPAADAEKLEGVEVGAQVNVIEEVQVNGVKVTPNANKAVNIEVPDAVVTSDKENQVTIEEDKTMTVNSLNVNKLVQTAGDTLILYGGSASDLINTNGAE